MTATPLQIFDILGVPAFCQFSSFLDNIEKIWEFLSSEIMVTLGIISNIFGECYFGFCIYENSSSSCCVSQVYTFCILA